MFPKFLGNYVYFWIQADVVTCILLELVDSIVDNWFAMDPWIIVIVIAVCATFSVVAICCNQLYRWILKSRVVPSESVDDDIAIITSSSATRNLTLVPTRSTSYEVPPSRPAYESRNNLPRDHDLSKGSYLYDRRSEVEIVSSESIGFVTESAINDLSEIFGTEWPSPSNKRPSTHQETNYQVPLERRDGYGTGRSSDPSLSFNSIPMRNFFTRSNSNARSTRGESDIPAIQLKTYVIVLTAWTSKFKTRMKESKDFNRIVNVLCPKYLSTIQRFIKEEANLKKNGGAYDSLQFLVDLDDALHPWANSRILKANWSEKLHYISTLEILKDTSRLSWKFLSVTFSQTANPLEASIEDTPVNAILNKGGSSFRYLNQTNVLSVIDLLKHVRNTYAGKRQLSGWSQARATDDSKDKQNIAKLPAESGFVSGGASNVPSPISPRERRSTITRAAITTLKGFSQKITAFQTKMFTGLSSWSFPSEIVYCSDKELLTNSDYDYSKQPTDSLSWGRIGTANFGSVVRACARANRAQLWWIEKKSANSYDTRQSLQQYRQIYIMRRLRHRNISNLLHMYKKPVDNKIGVSKEGQKSFDYYYLVMDINGRSLEDLLADEKEFTVFAVIRVVGQILNGLAYLHANHIVHGKVIPANIFISCSMVVKLVNLGQHPSIPNTDTTEASSDTQFTAPEEVARWLPTGDRIPTEWRGKYLGELHHGSPADIWSAAMIASHLLIRKMALNMANDLQLIEKAIYYLGRPSDSFIQSIDTISRQFFAGSGLRKDIVKLHYDEYLKTRGQEPKVEFRDVYKPNIAPEKIYKAMRKFPVQSYKNVRQDVSGDEKARSLIVISLIKFIDRALYIVPWERVTAAEALADQELPFLYDICRCIPWSLYRRDDSKRFRQSSKTHCNDETHIHSKADIPKMSKVIADRMKTYRDDNFKADFNGFNVSGVEQGSNGMDAWKERLYLEICDEKDYVEKVTDEMKYDDESVYRCMDPEYAPVEENYDSDNSMSFTLSSVDSM